MNEQLRAYEARKCVSSVTAVDGILIEASHRVFAFFISVIQMICLSFDRACYGHCLVVRSILCTGWLGFITSDFWCE